MLQAKQIHHEKAGHDSRNRRMPVSEGSDFRFRAPPSRGGMSLSGLPKAPRSSFLCRSDLPLRRRVRHRRRETVPRTMFLPGMRILHIRAERPGNRNPSGCVRRAEPVFTAVRTLDDTARKLAAPHRGRRAVPQEPRTRHLAQASAPREQMSGRHGAARQTCVPPEFRTNFRQMPHAKAKRDCQKAGRSLPSGQINWHRGGT